MQRHRFVLVKSIRVSELIFEVSCKRKNSETFSMHVLHLKENSICFIHKTRKESSLAVLFIYFPMHFFNSFFEK